MNILRWCALLIVTSCQAGLTPADSAHAPVPASIKLATWNLEWLIAPPAFRSLRESCVPQGTSPGGRHRFIPCDVAVGQERASQDYAALARYAKRLDADVIAIEEVDGAAAAQLVFKGYHFCFTSRDAVQNTGFAIRFGMPYSCGADFFPLSLGDSVRRGAQLVLFPGDAREIHLLAIHLKSGCPRGPLDSGRSECTTLARQVPILEDWIDRQAASGHPFAVLGDFNRDLLNESGPALSETGAQRNVYAELDDGDPPAADLTNAAENQPFTNCSAAQNFNGYIDNILLSKTLETRRLPGSFERVTYATRDALQRKLSDHCPVALRIRLGD